MNMTPEWINVRKTDHEASALNRMCADKGKELEIPQHMPIFLPVIGTCEGDFDRDENGMQMTPEMMNKILEVDNDDVESKIRKGSKRPDE